MKIIVYAKMPKKYFDICEVRRCPKEAKHLIILYTKNREGSNVSEDYSFCEKHLKQFADEARQAVLKALGEGK